MAEEWRSVPGFEGRYEVSSLGRVRNVKRRRLLLPSRSTTGYLAVTLFGGSVRKQSFKVHRLVLMAFSGQQDTRLDVNHLDGNKLNNALANLEWCSRSENMHHAFATGLCVGAKGESNHQSKLTDQIVYQIRIRHFSHNESPALIARDVGVSRPCVVLALSGETWKHVPMPESATGKAMPR